MPSETVVTRFAPSPTGFLHIGGARTALFNWLFARANNGKFLIRIEDTDRARSTQAAVDAIHEGLDWLGLSPDEDPVYQSKQQDRHTEAAYELLERGGAYRCYLTPEEADAERARAHEAGHAFRSPWRDRTDTGEGSFVVRFRAPDDGETVIHDEVQGEVRFANKTFDDLVLLRADGTPTYMLAVVVDDHDMGITHVIRGDDHLVNAARQSQIYDALGWGKPVFAHVPLIHGDDGAKLSKRHGALGVEAYRDMGMLPEGLRNYLLRLGWSHGDQEIFTDDEVIKVFALDSINKAAPRLDLEKMASVNAHHLRDADDARLADLVIARLESEGAAKNPAQKRDQLIAAMPALKPRAKTINELADQTAFLFASRPLEITGKIAKSLNDDAKERLNRLKDALGALDDWSAQALGDALKAFAEEEGVGFGKVGAPLRAALTAGAPAPDLSDTLAALGRDESLGRISDQI